MNTQTPLLRMNEDVHLRHPGPSVALQDLEPGVDCKFTTGGVTRMIRPLLNRWVERGVVDQASWVCMNGERSTADVTDGRITIRFVSLERDLRRGYAHVKEHMWAHLNGLVNRAAPAPYGAGIPEDSWNAFETYQRRSARALEESSHAMGGIDLVYVHDFQQVGVGRLWRGPEVPKVFHLHTPFPGSLAPEWAEFFVRRLDAYDSVIVSTHSYAKALRDAGLRSRLHVLPPFIDPADYPEPRARDLDALRERYGIAESDLVILNVARMDPMKGQDRLIRAMSLLLRNVPQARLVLVGNGSFSSAKKGGLGLSKGEKWRHHLEALARELGVEDRVTFTGHLANELIPAAYRAARVFALPSTREGFGLVAVEAWRHDVPVVVSERAGVSDLVTSGENGFIVDASDIDELASALLHLLLHDEEARSMGKAGRAASEKATLPVGAKALERIFTELLEAPTRAARFR